MSSYHFTIQCVLELNEAACSTTMHPLPLITDESMRDALLRISKNICSNTVANPCFLVLNGGLITTFAPICKTIIGPYSNAGRLNVMSNKNVHPDILSILLSLQV